MARRRAPALRVGARVRLLRSWYLPNRLVLNTDTGEIRAAGPDPDIWMVKLDTPAQWTWPDGTRRPLNLFPEDYLHTVYEHAELLEVLT